MAPWWNRSRRQDPLGTGVWRRAEDRFRRAVDRYDQVLERVEAVAAEPGRPAEPGGPAEPGRPAEPGGPAPPRGPADATGTANSGGVSSTDVTRDLAPLTATGAQLADLLARVHAVCLAAQALGPSDGQDIPPGPGGMLLDVHRALARAGTLVAQAAQSVTMVLVSIGAGRHGETAAATLGARRATEQAEIHVARAEVLIQRGAGDDGAEGGRRS
jgi:hypothetical protein